MRIDARGVRKWSGLGTVSALVLASAAAGSRGDGPDSSKAAASVSVSVSVRDPTDSQGSLAKKKEHCSADPDLLRSIGRSKGEQVRISGGTTSPSSPWPRRSTRPADASSGSAGSAGPGSARPQQFDGRVEATVIVPNLTDEQAKERGELVERLDDDGKNTGCLSSPRTAARSSRSTDLAGRAARRRPGPQPVTTWLCRGSIPGPATSRPSTAGTSPRPRSARRAIPASAKVADRPFAHAVSFHGMVDDRVLIGGAAPTRLRTEIRDAIRAGIKDPKIVVDLAMPGDANGLGKAQHREPLLPDGRGADRAIRPGPQEHWEEVADAVAKVFASKL